MISNVVIQGFRKFRRFSIAPDPAMNEKALDIMEGLQIEVVNR